MLQVNITFKLDNVYSIEFLTISSPHIYKSSIYCYGICHKVPLLRVTYIAICRSTYVQVKSAKNWTHIMHISRQTRFRNRHLLIIPNIPDHAYIFCAVVCFWSSIFFWILPAIYTDLGFFISFAKGCAWRFQGRKDR